MWPIMFATSFHSSMNCIPDLPGKIVDWVPVDVAARTVGEILLRPNVGEEEMVNGKEEGKEEGGFEVFNIVNPNPIPWGELVEMLRESYSAHHNDAKELEVVSMRTWVARLTALSLSPECLSADELPGLKLLGFFEDMAGDEEPSKVFETGKCTEISKALKNCEAFRGEWIDGNMKVWKEAGFVV